MGKNDFDGDDKEIIVINICGMLFHVLLHLVLRTTQWRRCYNNPHFTGEEVGA